MALDVGGDEGAERHDVQPLGAGLVEREDGQKAAESSALERRVDLGVREDPASRLIPVCGQADAGIIDEDLEAAPLRLVYDARLVSWCAWARSCSTPLDLSCLCPSSGWNERATRRRGRGEGTVTGNEQS